MPRKKTVSSSWYKTKKRVRKLTLTQKRVNGHDLPITLYKWLLVQKSVM